MFSLSDCNPVVELNPEHNVQGFVCKRDGFEKFLKKDATLYKDELLCVTHIYTPKTDPSKVVAYYTASNDALQVSNLPRSRKDKVKKRVSHEKRHLDTHPAILIGRLAVDKVLANPGVGSDILNVIKAELITTAQKSACRYIIVDAINEPEVLSFYLKNSFEYLFPEEKTEKEYYEKTVLKSRYMFFDLLPLYNAYLSTQN